MERPTLAEQVTKLYELIAGLHATHLLDIGQTLGVWEAITAAPGTTAATLATQLAVDPSYLDALLRTAFAFELLDREGPGWRMAPHFDQILGTPDATFYLGTAARTHLVLAEDYADYVRRFRSGTVVPYQEHGPAFMETIGVGLRTLPRIFLDHVLPKLPRLAERLAGGARVLDVGCGTGAAIIQLAERFPGVRCVGVDIEPHSVALAQREIAARGLGDRVEARVAGAERLAEDAAYDIATSFLVIHEIAPQDKAAAFAAVARALRPGGAFVIFDEVYPESDAALRAMPTRFAALAQWFELTWGNVLNTRSELERLCAGAGLRLGDETTFSRFYIGVAEKA